MDWKKLLLRLNGVGPALADYLGGADPESLSVVEETDDFNFMKKAESVGNPGSVVVLVGEWGEITSYPAVRMKADDFTSAVSDPDVFAFVLVDMTNDPPSLTVKFKS